MIDAYNFPGKAPEARRLTGRGVAVILTVITSVLTAVEGVWGLGLYRHWTFVAVIIGLLAVLVYASVSDFKKRSSFALMSHLGLAIVLLGGLLSAVGRTDAYMTVYIDGEAEHIACDERGYAVPLPFSIALKDFRTDFYDDGVSPKQYTSSLEVVGEPGSVCLLETGVNHPCRYRGYRIYQSGYDTYEGRYSVLKVVRDPWLAMLGLGALMLALSAILSLKNTWRSRKIVFAALALAAIFAIISVARINFGALPPALRSLWFVPHLIVYMLAYAVMAMAVIAAIAAQYSGKVPVHLSRRLLSTASALLLVGMLCGAVWAQQAWGDYWTWDAKECWAAVTWLLTLAATHSRGRKPALVFTVLAFLAIQMTWYGVNYLPAAMHSLHTYN